MRQILISIMHSNGLIGLDVGDIRVGVAVSDPLSVIATAYGTYVRAKGEAERKILQLIQERSPRALVVGLPLSKEGKRTAQCERVERFVKRLERRAKVSIIYIDEYLSSEQAKEILRARGAGPRACEAGAVDSTAAALILQDFLTRERGGEKGN